MQNMQWLYHYWDIGPPVSTTKCIFYQSFAFKNQCLFRTQSNVSSAGNSKVEKCQREMSAFTTCPSLPLLFPCSCPLSYKFGSVQQVCLGKRCEVAMGNRFVFQDLRSIEENYKWESEPCAFIVEETVLRPFALVLKHTDRSHWKRAKKCTTST